MKLEVNINGQGYGDVKLDDKEVQATYIGLAVVPGKEVKLMLSIVVNDGMKLSLKDLKLESEVERPLGSSSPDLRAIP